MSTLSPLVDRELDEVTGGSAYSYSWGALYKANSAAIYQTAANVAIYNYSVLQSNYQNANIAQS